MGSPNDAEKMASAAVTLERYGIEADVRVMSAHRSPAQVAEFGRAPTCAARSSSSEFSSSVRVRMGTRSKFIINPSTLVTSAVRGRGNPNKWRG